MTLATAKELPNCRVCRHPVALKHEARWTIVCTGCGRRVGDSELESEVLLDYRADQLATEASSQ